MKEELTRTLSPNSLFKDSKYLSTVQKIYYGGLLTNFLNYEDRKVKINERLEKMFGWIMANDQQTVMDMLLKLKKDKDSAQLWAECATVFQCHKKFSRNVNQDTDIRAAFPSGEAGLKIGDGWKKAEIRSVETKQGKKDFLILDLDLSESWKLSKEDQSNITNSIQETSPVIKQETTLGGYLTKFIVAYFEHRSHISKDVPMKIVIPVDLNNMPMIGKKSVLSLLEEGINIDKVKNANAYRNLINYAFKISEVFQKAKKTYFRFHGWTGNAESSLQDKTLGHLAALGPSAIGIFPSGAGIDYSLADNLYGIKATTPKIYGQQLFVMMDFLKVWDKELYLNGHSLGGAAMYWLVDDIIKRAYNNGAELPKMRVIAENPALKDTCVFLDDLLLKLGELALKTGVAKLAPKILSKIAEYYTGIISPEEYSKDVRLFHSGKFSDLGEALAILMEMHGLRSQADLPQELVERNNAKVASGKLFFLNIVAGEDRITSAKIQLKKLKEYRLQTPTLNFTKDGHFVHMSKDFTDFIGFLFEKLSKSYNHTELTDKMAEYVKHKPSVKLISPTYL